MTSLTNGAAEGWWLYVLLCANERLYIGIARNVEARFELHRAGKGAFYTRLNAPVKILARQRHESRSAALKAEYALKQLNKMQKRAWIVSVTGGS
jgi:predicted GIY-YIG superfamily endonuclease